MYTRFHDVRLSSQQNNLLHILHPHRYMFIGGTNFGYWNGGCTLVWWDDIIIFLLTKRPHPLIASSYPRCQFTIRRAAHELRLRCPALGSRRPHREVLRYSRGDQNGKNARAALFVLFFKCEFSCISCTVRSTNSSFHNSTIRYQRDRYHQQLQSTHMGL